jgi:hypothetical protein
LKKPTLQKCPTCKGAVYVLCPGCKGAQLVPVTLKLTPLVVPVEYSEDERREARQLMGIDR